MPKQGTVGKCVFHIEDLLIAITEMLETLFVLDMLTHRGDEPHHQAELVRTGDDVVYVSKEALVELRGIPSDERMVPVEVRHFKATEDVSLDYRESLASPVRKVDVDITVI